MCHHQAAKRKTTEQGVVRVPDDCNTLEEAVKKVHEEGCFTTIVVGKGKKHQIDGKYLEIFSAMNIVGDSGVPKEKIVIIGGVYFKRGFKGIVICNTLRCAKQRGVKCLDIPLFR